MFWKNKMKTLCCLMQCLLMWTHMGASEEDSKAHFNRDPVLSVPPSPNCKTPEISKNDIKDAFAYARSQAQKRIEEENEFVKTDYLIPSDENTLSGRLLGVTSNKSLAQHRTQVQFEDATKFLAERKGLAADELCSLRHLVLPRDEPVVQQCKKLKETNPCDTSTKYRTADGSCNNLKNPSWGSTSSCYGRVLEAAYNDGLESPRVSRLGNRELPNVRFLTTKVHSEANFTSNEFSHMVIGFGQMLAHDMAATTFTPAGDEAVWYNCCPRNSSVTFPSACIPIDIPENDYFFSNLNPKQTCLNLIRATACSADCTLGTPRRHVNQQTGFIDGSAVYGSTEEQMRSLRTSDKDFPGGLLYQKTEDGFLLPASFNPKLDQCSFAMTNDCLCFEAGDGRVNLQPGLTVMHTAWLILHNFVVTALAQNSPNKTDEFLFQEGRRVVAALMQSVIYQEYLPLVIGDRLMDFFKLKVKQRGYTKYDPTVDPSVITESSFAPLRFGHSTAQNYFQQFDKDEMRDDDINLRYNMNHPVDVCEGRRDDIVRGLYHEGAQNVDRFFSNSVTNHLLEMPRVEFGHDLVSTNLQRGRDTGLPSYTELLEYCYGEKINNFSDLTFVMTQGHWKRLERVYKSVRDIDAFTGGLLETRLPGAMTGPTFACLIGKQFHNSKFGDRYFFEHGNEAGSFTEGQLKELRKATLAKVFCVSSDSITRITRRVFLTMNSQNSLVDCESIEGLNFTNWFNL